MMKQFTVLALGAICLSAQLASAEDKKPAAPAASSAATTPDAFKTEGQKVGYSIGVDVARNLKNQFEGMDVDSNALAQGFSDGLTAKPKLSDADMKKAIDGFRSKMMEKMMARQEEQQKQNKVLGAKNLDAGKKFLEENGKKADVKTTKSGLQYTVIKEGTGPTPKATDQVEVHYRGTLIDGKEFDSSYKRGQPAVFGVNQVIKGWTEALQMMKVGSKYKLFVPPDLGYGEMGAGEDIPPNSVLIFEVELLKIKS